MAAEKIPSDWLPYVAEDPKLAGCVSLDDLHERLNELSILQIEKDKQRFVFYLSQNAICIGKDFSRCVHACMARER